MSLNEFTHEVNMWLKNCVSVDVVANEKEYENENVSV